MKLNTTDLLSKLPDFEDFVAISDEIARLSLEKMLLDKQIKQAEADVVLTCSNSPEYFVGGKPPSFSFIENTYKFTGIKGEILPLRERYAEVSAQLESAKIKLSVYRDMLEVWRTLSANERASL